MTIRYGDDAAYNNAFSEHHPRSVRNRESKLSLFHKVFVCVERATSIWYLGYNTQANKFVAWSTSEGPGKFKFISTIDELRNLYRWHLDEGYELTQINQQNIDQYAYLQ